MTRKGNFKDHLIERFKDDEAIGVKEVDYSTGLSQEEYEEDGLFDDYEGVSVLPDGTQMATCTNCANFVVEALGEGDVYGFFTSDNPSVTDYEILGSGGHDFAVIRNRYIVDLWVRHFVGTSKKHVFDLHDPADRNEIKALYGDLNCWSKHDVGGHGLTLMADIPIEERPKISRHEESSISCSL